MVLEMVLVLSFKAATVGDILAEFRWTAATKSLDKLFTQKA